MWVYKTYISMNFKMLSKDISIPKLFETVNQELLFLFVNVLYKS